MATVINMRFRKRLLLALLVPAFLALLFALFLLLRGPAVEIAVTPASFRKSSFHFIPEHWQEPRLRQLREGEDFKSLGGRDQLDLLLNYCHWTHRQWPMSVPDPYPRSNAIDILADIRSGKTGGFCGQYAYVLADVLKSMGFFAVRYVELWSREGESHFVVEAWSDQFAKWLVLDPAEDVYYAFQDSRRPASALEVRAGLFTPGTVAAFSAAPPRTGRGNHKMHLYANVAVSMRSDLMRLDKPPTVGDRFNSFVFFHDGRDVSRAFAGRIPYALVTSRADDINFDCNYVRVDARHDREREKIVLEFASEGSMFNFAHFAFTTDEGKTWTRCGNGLELALAERVASLQVAPVNALGRFGRPTRVTFRYRG